MKKYILVPYLFTFLFSCHNKVQQNKIKPVTVIHSIIKKDSLTEDSVQQTVHGRKLDSQYISTLKPIFGYRFVVTGNFKGDGKTDTVTEHYFDTEKNKETNKYYDSIDFDTQMAIAIMYKSPYSFITCSDHSIDTLSVCKGGQLFGLSYLKNEGDLNGDGTDELSYVIDYADYSAINTCHLVTYKNGRWKELYSFEIRDWELPGLPDAQTNYGLFGIDSLHAGSSNDSLNKQAEKELKEFSGFIVRSGKGKIKVHTFNEGEEVVKVVNLNKVHLKDVPN
ncbi:MAG TPA: hypothetical protein VK718_05495 [Ferruginibacter sp.]|jgi:hypothetical protein|nr:hypothetical protein [Ferruginibacter sp.]